MSRTPGRGLGPPLAAAICLTPRWVLQAASHRPKSATFILVFQTVIETVQNLSNEPKRLSNYGVSVHGRIDTSNYAVQMTWGRHRRLQRYLLRPPSNPKEVRCPIPPKPAQRVR